MIKGCQKKIIHLKSTNSPYFEEAYFILKESAYSLSENDMIKEAEKIAESTKNQGSQKRPIFLRKNIAFMIVGGIITLITSLCVILICSLFA